MTEQDRNQDHTTNCNIVRDLLPLYQENLCSEDSRDYVERHLEQCKSCRDTYSLLGRTTLTSEAAQTRQIQAFKKLQRYLTGRISMGYILFMIAVVIGVCLMMLNVNGGQNFYLLNYLLMTLTMIATQCAFGGIDAADAPGRGRAMYILQGLLLAGSVSAMFYTFYTLYHSPTFYAQGANVGPLGIPLHMTGPLLTGCLEVAILLSLILLCVCLCRSAMGKMRIGILANLSVLCIFMNLNYISLMHRMSDYASMFRVTLGSTCVLCGIYAALTLIAWLWQRSRTRNDLP
ncbi:MAG: zf-HC2 domain-containing protein [Clostridium sp.]|nr:zf-HC2 domain-containing protein [Acetatifactor muris]MCM1527376.1 zf-HC2 domain-containing protein [Bacteroides sp.]MCM1563560.1 zf-HC2 domain-containing protein [Clostridium sp.]